MTHLCRSVCLAILAAAPAAFGHPGHEVGNLDHLVESPDHWLPLVATAVVFGGLAVMAGKWWRDAKRSDTVVEPVRPTRRADAE